jgi:hypothetical protein
MIVRSFAAISASSQEIEMVERYDWHCSESERVLTLTFSVRLKVQVQVLVPGTPRQIQYGFRVPAWHILM